jgi:transcriptional regulator with XRE-family HTH domain
MQEDIILQISNRVKELRTAKSYTLQEVADKVGVTRGFLSQIENTRTVPSLSVLISIIRALGVDLNSFFQDMETNRGDDKVVLRKKEQYQHFEKENAKGFYYQRIFTTQINEQHVDIVLLRLSAKAKRPAVRTDAWEYKYIIKGTVEYTIGKEKYLLEEGDSLYFDARELHNPKNMGTEDALMLVFYFFDKKV